MSTLLALYYFSIGVLNVEPQKKNFLRWLGPFSFLIPQLFNDVGRRAIVKGAFFLLLFGASFGGAALTHKLLDDARNGGPHGFLHQLTGDR
jgi:hypothetical protein